MVDFFKASGCVLRGKVGRKGHYCERSEAIFEDEANRLANDMASTGSMGGNIGAFRKFSNLL